MPTPPRIPCEFFLIRYVPDVVKGEFTNIGVLLREVDLRPDVPAPRLQFTRDWTRVRRMHPDVDIALLESLETEMLDRLQSDLHLSADAYPRPILPALIDSLSNSIQISEPRACLAENLTLELEQLMRLYVEPLKASSAARQRTGRAAIVTAMRSAFETTGVWAQMRKRIPAAQYTRPGDPMKLDCGYSFEVPDAEREATSREDILRIFHAVSLQTDVESARSLAFTAPQLLEGVVQSAQINCSRSGRRWIGLEFDLAAVVEPLRALSSEKEDFTGEAADLYRFGISTLESAGIRVLTTNNLAAAAQTARAELRL